MQSQGSQPHSDPRLVHAAHEFEAQMMAELLKPLTRSGALAGDEDSGSTGALGEFAGETLGQALSEQGGFGIADRILGQLSQIGNRPGTVPVTAIPNLKSGISALK